LPSHPIGKQRKTWRFRISEIDAYLSNSRKQPHGTMGSAVPGARERCLG
jgi:hypothetical protein